MTVYLGDQEVGVNGLDAISSGEGSNYKGEWDKTTEYHEGDIVKHYSRFYIAINDNTNVDVYTSDTWAEITDRDKYFTWFNNSLSNQDMRLLLTYQNDTAIGPTFGSVAKVVQTNGPTVNPSTGLMKVPGGIDGYVNETNLSDRLSNYLQSSDYLLNKITSDPYVLMSLYFDNNNVIHLRHGNVVKTSANSNWSSEYLTNDLKADIVLGTNDDDNSTPYYIFVDFDNNKLIGVVDSDLYVSSSQPENVTKSGSVWFVKSNRYFKVFDGTGWNNVTWSFPIARINYNRILNKFDTCGFMKDTAFILPGWNAIYSTGNDYEWMNYQESTFSKLILFDMDKNNGCNDSDVYVNINTGEIVEDKLTSKIVYNPTDNCTYKTTRNNPGLKNVSKLTNGFIKVFRYIYYQYREKNNLLEFQPYNKNNKNSKYFDIWNYADQTCKYFNINKAGLSLDSYNCPVDGQLYVTGTSKLNNAWISVQIGYYNGGVTKIYDGYFDLNVNFRMVIPVKKGDSISLVAYGTIDNEYQKLILGTHYVIRDYQLIFGGYAEV